MLKKNLNKFFFFLIKEFCSINFIDKTIRRLLAVPGFPGGSDGKASARNAGDPGSISSS